jgi:hypothetical protein
MSSLPRHAWPFWTGRGKLPPVATGLSRVARLVYFMAPAYIANMTPPLVRYWRGWNRPISVRWLGSHKTIVGFGAGLLMAVVVTLAQSRSPGQAGSSRMTIGSRSVFDSALGPWRATPPRAS